VEKIVVVWILFVVDAGLVCWSLWARVRTPLDLARRVAQLRTSDLAPRLRVARIL